MGCGMLVKEAVRIGDLVTQANPHVLGYGLKMEVVGLTAVEKLVYCKGGYAGEGLYHLDNLKRFGEK